MKEDLPAPPVPPGLSLRHLPYLPLKIKELLGSALVRKASGDAFRAAVLLWVAAWWEVPAASLPDDEAELMAIAGYRGQGEAWAAVRGDAMRGFIKCADGRLYHGTLVTAALEAAIKARKKGQQTEAARAALEAKRRGGHLPKVDDPLLQTNGTSVTEAKLMPDRDCNNREEEQEREGEDNKSSSGNRLPRARTSVTATVTALQRPDLPQDDTLLYRLMEAAGPKLGSHPALFVIGHIEALIESGEVTLLEDVLPVIREKASRVTIPDGTVNSWKFYVADIRAHAARRKAQDSKIGAGKTLSVEEIMGGSKT